MYVVGHARDRHYGDEITLFNSVTDLGGGPLKSCKKLYTCVTLSKHHGPNPLICTLRLPSHPCYVGLDPTLLSMI